MSSSASTAATTERPIRSAAPQTHTRCIRGTLGSRGSPRRPDPSDTDGVSAIFGETLTFSQPAGPPVGLRVFGDEFYARYETLDGHTVVLDTDLGLYCYATV